MEFLLLARHLLRQVFTLLFVANFPPFKTSPTTRPWELLRQVFTLLFVANFKTSPTTRSWELLSSDKIDVVSYI